MKAQCPTCKKEQTFLSYGGYYKFITYGRQCRSCSKKKPPHTEESLTLECKRCGKKKIYPNIGQKNEAVKDGRRYCKSCAAILHNGMKGRHLSEEHKKSISGENHYQYGKPLSDEVKEKIRKKLIGEQNPFFGKKHTEEEHKKNIERNTGKNHPNYGKPHTEDTKKKLRVARMKWLDSIGAVGENGKSYNKNGCEYLDQFSKENGWNIQHAMNGGEKQISGYSVDGYDSERNIVIEYDEPAHYDGFGNLKKNDVERMNRIIKEQKCKFYRYNEKTQQLKEHHEICPKME